MNRDRKKDTETVKVAQSENYEKLWRAKIFFLCFLGEKSLLIDKFYMMRLFERKASDKDKRSLPKFNLKQLQRTLSNNLIFIF